MGVFLPESLGIHGQQSGVALELEFGDTVTDQRRGERVLCPEQRGLGIEEIADLGPAGLEKQVGTGDAPLGQGRGLRLDAEFLACLEQRAEAVPHVEFDLVFDRLRVADRVLEVNKPPAVGVTFRNAVEPEVEGESAAVIPVARADVGAGRAGRRGRAEFPRRTGPREGHFRA